MEIIALLLAHSFYSAECCSGRDCHPVPCDQIVMMPNGDFRWNKVMFNRSVMHVSEDGGCHVCVADAMAMIGRCLYLPPQT